MRSFYIVLLLVSQACLGAEDTDSKNVIGAEDTDSKNVIWKFDTT